MTPERPIFFISDHTGITAEIIGKSLLSQFPEEAFAFTSVPFVDSLEKAFSAAQQVKRAWKASSIKPFVFSTLTDPDARSALASCEAVIMDIYGHFLGMMVAEIGHPATPLRGRFHGMQDSVGYGSRIDAVNFTLAADDGLGVEKYTHADLILLGVSRSGKTPTALYMAMQYGLRVANYPLTPENFERPGLPDSLKPQREKLRGLTLSPERLAKIRAERRPGSTYSNLQTCRQEIQAAEAMMRAENIPIVDSSARSVEEIAALLRVSMATPTAG